MNAVDEVLGSLVQRGLVDAPAILTRDRTLTYGQLEKGLSQFGNACLAAGVNRQDRVALMIRDRPDVFHVALGAMKIGAVSVPLSLRLAARDLASILADSRARLLVLDAEFLPLYREVAGQLAAPPRVIVADLPGTGEETMAEFVAGHSRELESRQMDPEDMLLWIYTSGTTGKPKAVVHVHRSVRSTTRYLSDVLGVAPGDRLFATSKLFFAFSFAHCVLGNLRAGSAVILHEGWPDTAGIVEVVRRHRPTVMLSVPAFFNRLVNEGSASDPAFGQVRHYVSAGEKLPATLYERWLATVGKPLLDCVGASETLILFLGSRPDAHGPGLCGVPNPGVEVELRDDGDNVIERANVPGVAWVKSDSLAVQYWNDPGQSGKVFRDGWFCTGDIFTRTAEGLYSHQGRSDERLKISSQWVSPSEIENQALKHPEVLDAAVVGVPNPDGLTRLAIFLSGPKTEADRERVREEVTRDMLAALSVYKCPRRFVFLDELPRTATGKIQRYVLREQAANQIKWT